MNNQQPNINGDEKDAKATANGKRVTSSFIDADIRKTITDFFSDNVTDIPIIVDMPYAQYPADDIGETHDGGDETKTKHRKASASVNQYYSSFKSALQSAVAHYKGGQDSQNVPEDTISQNQGFFVSGGDNFTDEYALWQRLTHRPVVYIVYFRRPKQKKWSVYVGETNHIINRTVQHVLNIPVDQNGDEGVDFEDVVSKKNKETAADKAISLALHDGIAVRQLVIWHRLFNKSLTLDIENKLIDYTQSMYNVESLNARPNAQDLYYTYSAKNPLVSLIWNRLSSTNDTIVDRYASLQGISEPGPIFIGEDKIWQTSLFKFSPYHTLGEEQQRGLDEIVSAIKTYLESRKGNEPARLYFVAGAAGTGKSILMTALYYKLGTYFRINNPESPINEHLRLLTYNKELQKIYADIGNRAGLTGGLADKTQPLNPTTFINDETPCEQIPKISSKEGNGNVTITGYSRPRLYWLWPFDGKPIKGKNQQDADSAVEAIVSDIVANDKHTTRDSHRTDVVLIDEAHLLFTQVGQGYQGDSQLHDILRRAKVVIAVFDPNQIMNNTQRWDIDYDIESKLSGSTAHPDNEQELINCGTIRFQDDNDMLGKLLDQRAGRQWEGDAYQTFCFPLHHQYRIDAGKNIDSWIRKVTTSIRMQQNDDSAQEYPTIPPIPAHDSYYADDSRIDQDILPSYHTDFTITVCDSPQELWDAINDKRQETIAEQDKQQADDGLPHLDLCRVLATYDWPYNGKSKTVDLTLGPDGVWRKPEKADPENDFHRSWNGVTEDDGNGNDPWNSRDSTREEIGSYYTIQGFDLNYAGVIIGPSVRYNIEHDRLEFHPEESKDKNIKKDYNKILADVRADHTDESGNTDISDEEITAIADTIWRQQKKYIQNQFNVLITRAVHGLYLFAVDEALQHRLKEAAREGLEQFEQLKLQNE